MFAEKRPHSKHKKRYWITCEDCGTRKRVAYPHARYCGDACREHARLQRRKDRLALEAAFRVDVQRLKSIGDSPDHQTTEKMIALARAFLRAGLWSGSDDLYFYDPTAIYEAIHARGVSPSALVFERQTLGGLAYSIVKIPV